MSKGKPPNDATPGRDEQGPALSPRKRGSSSVPSLQGTAHAPGRATTRDPEPQILKAENALNGGTAGTVLQAGNMVVNHLTLAHEKDEHDHGQQPARSSAGKGILLLIALLPFLGFAVFAVAAWAVWAAFSHP